MKGRCLFLTFLLVLVAFASAEAGLVGRIYVGEFAPGSIKTSPEMSRQVMDGLGRLPDEDLSIKVYAYTDESGPVELNKELAFKRVVAIAGLLYELTGKEFECLDAKGFVYEWKKNEINRRFGIIEFWTPDKTEALASAQPSVAEEMKEEKEKPIATIGLEKVELARIGQSLLSLADGQEGIRSVLATAKEEHSVLMSDVLWAKYGFLLLSSAMLISTALIVFFLNTLRRQFRPRNKEVWTIEEGLVASQVIHDRDEWLRTKDGEKQYKVLCHYTLYADGKAIWTSPFQNESGLPIVRAEKKTMVKSLHGCVSGANFATQKAQLIADGRIKIIKQEP
jgi:hypothetical protein